MLSVCASRLTAGSTSAAMNRVICVMTDFIGISHLIVCSGPAWAVFQDFDSSPHWCRYFSSSFGFHAPFFLFRGSADAIWNPQSLFCLHSLDFPFFVALT